MAFRSFGRLKRPCKSFVTLACSFFRSATSSFERSERVKPRLAQLLRCPIDRGPLDLLVFEEKPASPLTDEERARARDMGIEAAALEREIVAGALLNPRLKMAYAVL